MKTIKTQLTHKGTALYIKGLLFALCTGCISLILLLLIFSTLLLLSGNLPHNSIIWMDIAACAISAFAASYVCARTIKSKGLIWGLVTGFSMFFIQFTAGFIADSGDLSYISLIKLLVFIMFGCFGGIKGVNKKDKIRIK